jgi:uncharacterized protein
MKKFSPFIIALAVLVGGMLIYSIMKGKSPKKTPPPPPQVEIGSITMNVELADTSEKKVLGLSNRENLLPDTGMLFLLTEAGRPTFWMKDMKFPIDIIWIGSDFTISDIHHNVRPDSYPKVFSPSKDTQFVLEVNAGWAVKHKLAIGSPIKFINIQI